MCWARRGIPLSCAKPPSPARFWSSRFESILPASSSSSSAREGRCGASKGQPAAHGTARARRIASLSVREKRQIFTWMRDAADGGRGHDLFMPKFGCTMGEFCTWHILAKQVLAEE